MADQNICRYNKFGHCKFQGKCNKSHINEVCNIPSCEISKCRSRHPNMCTYFRDYGKCKFGDWCSYQHKREGVNQCESKYKELYEKIIELEEVMVDKDKQIRDLTEKIDLMKISDKFDMIQKLIEDKSKEIVDIQMKLDNIEDKSVINSVTEDQETETIENLDMTFCNASVTFNCEECEFVAKNSTGLKIHRKAKHIADRGPIPEV